MTFNGQKIDGQLVATWVYRVVLSAFVAGGFFAASMFATHDQVALAVKPLATIPPRVEALEKMSNDRTIELAKAAMLRAEELKDYNNWRRSKDEIDTKLASIIEFQKELSNRQQLMLDRQQSQIDEINRRPR